MAKRILIFSLFFAGVLAIAFACGKTSNSGQVTSPATPTPPTPPVVGTNDVDFWLTKGDQTVLVAKTIYGSFFRYGSKSIIHL